MTEDRIARRNRGNANGLWLLAALTLVAGLLVIAVVLKTSAERQRARIETEAAATAPHEKSSTNSPTGSPASPLPVT